MVAPRPQSVCVLGAGASGLAVIKELKEEGHHPTCFEHATAIGGVFHHKPDKPGGVYDNLYLTISNYHMAYSDFMPKGARFHWDHREYHAYLEDYCVHFDLTKHIQLGQQVVEIREQAEGGRRWRVTTKCVQSGELTDHAFDAVTICAGTNQIKKIPSLPGLDSFQGELYHASDYKTNDKFSGKRVCVVGIGESSADIARELSDIASECHLCLRSYPIILPRVGGWWNYLDSSDAFSSRLIASSGFGTGVIKQLVTGMTLAFNALHWVCDCMLPARTTDAMRQDASAGMLDLNTPATPEARSLIKTWSVTSLKRNGNRFYTKNATFVPNVVSGKLKVAPSPPSHQDCPAALALRTRPPTDPPILRGSREGALRPCHHPRCAVF